MSVTGIGNDRIARVRASLADRGLDGLIVSQPQNRRYLSGVRALESPGSASAGWLIVLPRTAVFLSFLDEEGSEVSFVHVFADSEAMDLHIEGADERARAAYEAIEPLGWEVYGTPSDAASRAIPPI